MAFDEGLAERIREVLHADQGVTERKMFGGLAFMLRGNMLVGILGDRLMARVGPDAHPQALTRPHVRPMDFSGRPMKGYVYVDPPGYLEDDALAEWVQLCRTFVLGLPAKPVSGGR